MKDKILEEIQSFQQLWVGGYFGENNEKRNQVGLENYLQHNVGKQLNILEIGCGRGRWSKYIVENLNPNHLHCLDVLSDVHNNFWSFVGQEKKEIITYSQVKDFELNDVKDESLDFVFSYDVWCHISELGQKKYLENLLKKCKHGCKLLIMYADPYKYYNSEPNKLWFIKGYLPKEKVKNCKTNEEIFDLAIQDSDGQKIPGRWYWIGKEKFIVNCLNFGYEILSEDLKIDNTNIITLLEKK